MRQLQARASCSCLSSMIWLLMLCMYLRIMQVYFEPPWHHCSKAQGSTFCINDTTPEQVKNTYL